MIPFSVLDLAPIVIPAWPAAPEGATATVALEGTGEPAVRLFRRVGDAWARFTPGQDTLDTAALRAGVTWGIESADFPTTDWDGTVRLRVSVTGAPTAIALPRALHVVQPLTASVSS